MRNLLKVIIQYYHHRKLKGNAFIIELQVSNPPSDYRNVTLFSATFLNFFLNVLVIT